MSGTVIVEQKNSNLKSSKRMKTNINISVRQQPLFEESKEEARSNDHKEIPDDVIVQPFSQMVHMNPMHSAAKSQNFFAEQTPVEKLNLQCHVYNVDPIVTHGTNVE